MFNREQLKNNREFLHIAYQMGYQIIDLLQIDEEKLEAESYETTKHMSQVEKNFYIRKKKEVLTNRQDAIFQKIYQQYIKSSKVPKRKKRYSYNPIVTKMLQDHEKRLNQKARYEERIRISKSRNVSRNHPGRNTIDLGRTSPNFSSVSRYSQVSRKSVRSQSSSRASNISRKSSHKDRLQMVRNKEREAENFKKNLYAQNQRKSQNKIHRVFHDRESYSRKLKTRSQISQQAVSEKKAQLATIQNQQIINHIQSLHYKIFKHEVIREKQIQEKKKHMHDDAVYKKQIKQMFDHNEKQKKRQQYQNKMYAAESKKMEVAEKQRELLLKKTEDRKVKELYSKKYRTHMKYQQAERSKMLQISQENSLVEAQKKRNQYKSDKKIKLLASRVKQQVNRSNLQSIQRKKQMQNLQKVKRYSQKMDELMEIEKLKKKLTKQKVHFKANTMDLRNSREYNFY